MKCPFCPFSGPWGEVHAHLGEAHTDRVEIRVEEALGRMSYRVVCPACGQPFRRPIKPRWGDTRFVEEFRPEICLVAFDLLLHHYALEHTPETAGDG